MKHQRTWIPPMVNNRKVKNAHQRESKFSLEDCNTFTGKKMQPLRGTKGKEIQTTAGSQPHREAYTHIDSIEVFLFLNLSWAPQLSCVCAQLLQSYPVLWDPMDCILPGSSVHGILQAGIVEWVAMSSSIHGILQAGIVEWVAMSSSRGSSWPRDRTWVS